MLTMIPHKSNLGGGRPNVRHIVIPIGNGILGTKIVPKKRDTQNIEGRVRVIDCIQNIIFERLPCIRGETNSNCAGIRQAGRAVGGLD
jgi:hypothetical protein